MEVTLSGISMDIKEVQFSNAPLPLQNIAEIALVFLIAIK